MAQTYEITRDGKTFDVTVEDGQDPNEALAQFTGSAPAPAPEMSLGDSVARGLGLSGRALVGAVPKTVAGLGDLVSAGANLGLAGIDKLGQLVGDNPVDYRLPTNHAGTVDRFLTDIGFPEPQGMGERIATGGLEMAIPGAAGAALLARAAPAIAAPASQTGVVRGLANDIADFFAKSPKMATAVESTGALGAETGNELAQEADTGPLGEFAATLLGGVAGGLTPAGVITGGRRLASTILEQLIPFTEAGGQARAARALQEAAADPAAAAEAARAAPEGVLPGRATQEPRLRAIEERVIADDPELQASVQGDLEAAADRSIARLTEGFGPGRNRQEWQQDVISRVAPDGAEIAVGQPDEMLNSVFRSYDQAYEVGRGYPIRNQVLQVEGGNVPMPERIVQAVMDEATLTGDEVRLRVGKWLEGRYKDTVRRGERVGGSDDSPLIEVTSDDLLQLRQVVRQEERRQRKAGVTNADAAATAELLGNADRAITEVLESQLPDSASAGLRAVDQRYAQFKVVEDAVRRSGEKGLTPEALRASATQSAGPGRAARGDTGQLGTLAEQGKSAKDLLKPSAQPDQVERTVRSMSDDQRARFQSDMNAELMRRATTGRNERMNGENYLKQIRDNRDKLRAAGFQPDQIGRMETIGRELRMIQSRSPSAVDELLQDNVSRVMRLFAAIAGSRAGIRALHFFGGTTGGGPGLVLAQFGSKSMQNLLTRVSADRADRILREAATNKELYAALLTRPTDSIKVQADAARTINAWLSQAASTEEE